MTSGSEAPRLPDRSNVVPLRPAAESAVDAGAIRADLSLPTAPSPLPLDSEWAPYDEPALVGTAAARRLVLAARVMTVAWALAVLVAAVVVRSNVGSGVDDGHLVTAAGWVGLAVIGVLVVGGWWWSDRVVRNVHRLDGRLPSRVRCVSGWLVPVAVAAFLSVTVLRVEPGELLDVRPLIAAPLLLAALWRPYALIRRVLTTLSRVGADALIGAAYVLDVAAFVLLWWRLETWPESLGSGSTGTIAVLIGVAAAATIAFGGGVAVWSMLLRTIHDAETHRRVALRTRHDHQQLRLRGIDPMDPDVRWAMLRIHQEEASDAAGADPVEIDAPSPERDPAAEQRIRVIADYLRHHMGGRDAAHHTTEPAPGRDEAVARLEAQRAATGADDEVDDTAEQQPSPPPLYLLQGVRYLLLISVAAVVATSAWVVSKAVLAADESVAGALIDTDVTDIDLARRAMVTAIGVMFAMVALWCAVLARQARHAGDGVAPDGRALALLAYATAANVMALLLDGDVRGSDGFLFIVLALSGALLAVVTVVPVIEFFDRRPRSSIIWAAGLPLLLLISWIGGLQRPLGPGDEVQVLTFVAATHTIVAGLVLVVAAVATSDVEEGARVSPGLARLRETSTASR